jgi:nitrate reductase NapD
MDIVGVLVRAHPRNLPLVQQHLQSIAGLAIHTVSEDGRLVVTLEDEDGKRIADTLGEVNRIEGVLSAAMVYQYSDDEGN